MSKEQILPSSIIRDVELGGFVVTQYLITCHFDWHDTQTFSLSIGNMQKEYMKGIVADYFWGFADMLSPRTLTGALYAVFSKGDDVLIHEFSNNIGGYTHHRVFILNAAKNLEKTYISTNNNLWVLLDKPESDSFAGASIRVKRCETHSCELPRWDVLVFPEYAHAGRFDRLPCTAANHNGLMSFSKTDTGGVLRVVDSDGVERNVLEIGDGIEFEAIYRFTTGRDGCAVAVFTYGSSVKLNVRPPDMIRHATRFEVSAYHPDMTKAMYMNKRLFSSKLWLDEDGVLCSPMSEPKTSDTSYWRFLEDKAGWSEYEPEDKTHI